MLKRPRSPSKKKLDYFDADSPAKCREALRMVRDLPVVGVDTETIGCDPGKESPVHKARAVSIQFSGGPGEPTIFVPLWDERIDNLRIFQEYLERPERVFVAHGTKYDAHVLLNHGIKLTGLLGDTMIMDEIFHSEEFRSHALKECVRRYFDDDGAVDFVDTFSEPILKKNGEPSARKRLVPLDEVIKRGGSELEKLRVYAVKDPLYTVQLFEYLKFELEQMTWGPDKSMWDYYEWRRDYTLILTGMERRGCRLNVKNLKAMGKLMAADILAAEKDFYRVAMKAGVHPDYLDTFNLASGDQLGHLLSVELGVDGLPVTAKGKVKTDAKTLQGLQDPVAKAIMSPILKRKSIEKLKGTFVDALLQCAAEYKGRVHTTLKETGAITGRLSSSNPNCQNIPKKTDTYGIRTCFVADEGEEIGNIDLSQAEVRLAAHLTQDRMLLKVVRDGWDAHALTLHRLDPDVAKACRKQGFGEVDKPMLDWIKTNFKDKRERKKPILFGTFYGMGPPGLAMQTGMSEREAARDIDGFFEVYPGLKRGIDHTVRVARKRGGVRTIMGRFIHLPHITSKVPRLRSGAERQAFNYIVQGGIGDIMMAAMLLIAKDPVLAKLKVKMLLQVHDELVFSMPAASLEKAKPIIERYMTHSFVEHGFAPLSVPFEADMAGGESWAEAKAKAA